MFPPFTLSRLTLQKLLTFACVLLFLFSLFSTIKNRAFRSNDRRSMGSGSQTDAVINVLQQHQQKSDYTTTSYPPPAASSLHFPEGASLSCVDWSAALAEVQTAKGRISAYWDVPRFPLFLGTVDIPPPAWELHRARLVKVMAEAQLMRLIDDDAYAANASSPSSSSNNNNNASTPPPNMGGETERKRKRKRFVIAFSGSSVTAGHDNFFHEAFPQVNS